MDDFDEIEDGEMRTNYYYCAECDIAWEDEWSCGCDDECPGCGNDYSPFDSEEQRDAARQKALTDAEGAE